MVDILVIGAGPAGISAAIYAKRAGASVAILHGGESSIEKAQKIDNYYGFEGGISGKELYEKGIKQAKMLDIDVRAEEVFNIQKEGDAYTIETATKNYNAKAVIISTGKKELRPNIEGIVDFEGKGVSYCAMCDGFFFKNKKVAVIGNQSFAIKEADYLRDIVSQLVILTDGKKIDLQDGYDVITKKIKKISGNSKVEFVEFEDGEPIKIDGIFVAIGNAGSTDFARKMGISLEGSSIKVNEKMETNISGLYACGNATGGLLQICKATYEGAIAGINAAQYVKNNK